MARELFLKTGQKAGQRFWSCLPFCGQLYAASVGQLLIALSSFIGTIGNRLRI